MSYIRFIASALILVAGLAIVSAEIADARVGGGRSFGSRGSKTFTAPPATRTAPGAAPVERSMAERRAVPPGAAVSSPASRFGGLRGLLLGGLFAAALGGIFGFGALASLLGFVLQFALIAGVVYFVVNYFRNRNQRPALSSARGYGDPSRDMADRPSFNFSGGGGSVPAAEPVSSLTIGQDDLNSFERLLGEIQTAYSREDTAELGAKTTPEMFSYFSQELSDAKSQGVRNEVSNVKLLQGDLSEAWREGNSDYATVAMRYSLVDATVDRTTGEVISGDRSNPSEVIELWTFRRDDNRSRPEGWQLSAIQQAA